MSPPAGQGDSTVSQATYAMGYQLVGNSVERLNHAHRIPTEVNRFGLLAGYRAGLLVSIAQGSPAYSWRRRLRTALLALPKRFLGSYDATRG
jgi:hypothetical protein